MGMRRGRPSPSPTPIGRKAWIVTSPQDVRPDNETTGKEARSPLPSSPTVSILLPTHTERGFIRDCLETIRRQDYDNLLEVLVIDGGSTDGTTAIAERFGAPFVVVDNPGVTAASAMNVGIARAKGEVIVRMDAHALYAPDYVRRSVEVLLETGADNVGGRMAPVGRSRFGRAVAAVTTTPLVMGPGKFHYSSAREEVDTVFLGCWYRSTLVELGGFDDHSLQWAAEDHELNLRLRQSGGRILLDPAIRSTYFPRETARSLARQYHNYGVAKVSTLAKHRTLPSPRALPPALLVAASAAGLVAGRGPWRVALPALHAAATAVVAGRTARRTDADAARCFAAIQLAHWCFGVGFWRGVARWATGRGFTPRPTGHR